MSLHSEGGFDAFLKTLAGVTFVDQWESHVAKVSGKVFCLLGRGDGDGRITVKVAEESFEILTAMDGIAQAPYFAKRKWVSIDEASGLGEDDLRHYIRRSYALVAAGLTKKLRAELGIILPE